MTEKELSEQIRESLDRRDRKIEDLESELKCLLEIVKVQDEYIKLAISELSTPLPQGTAYAGVQ